MEQTNKEKAQIFLKEWHGKNKLNEEYINEWIDRFESGHPETYMDEWTRGIYSRLIRTKKIIIETEVKDGK